MSDEPEDVGKVLELSDRLMTVGIDVRQIARVSVADLLLTAALNAGKARDAVGRLGHGDLSLEWEQLRKELLWSQMSAITLDNEIAKRKEAANADTGTTPAST